MTIVDREVTREEEKTKTVQTCDVCGLSELEIGDDTIDHITSGVNTSTRYVLSVDKLDEVDGAPVSNEEIEFDGYDAAMNYVNDLDMDTHSIRGKHSYISLEWDLNIDACTRCQKMMFGALRDNFDMKKV